MYDTRTERTVRQVKVKSIVIDFEAHNPAYVVAERGAAGLGLHTVSLRIGISPERFSFHLANSTHPIPKGFSAWA